MASYYQKDLKSYDDGELYFEDGDLVVADPQQSFRQLLVHFMNTTKGDFGGQNKLGWGGEKYMGRPNNALTHNSMYQDIMSSLGFLDDLAREDIILAVTAISAEEAGVVVLFNGLIFNDDGRPFTENVYLAFKFPFSTGRIEQGE